MADPISIFLVEDSAAMRLALRNLFEHDPQFFLVGVTDRVAAAVDEVNKLEPDVILVDYRLPDGTGVHVAESVLQSNNECAILGMSSDDANRKAFLAAGARGFFHKQTGFTVLSEQLIGAADL